MLNEQQITVRLEEVNKAIAQTMANLNALEGAKQELNFWLGKLKDAPVVTEEAAINE